MENLAVLSVREVKRAAEETDRDEYSSAQGQLIVKVRSKVIPASFLKIEGRGRSLGRESNT